MKKLNNSFESNRLSEFKFEIKEIQSFSESYYIYAVYIEFKTASPNSVNDVIPKEGTNSAAMALHLIFLSDFYRYQKVGKRPMSALKKAVCKIWEIFGQFT